MASDLCSSNCNEKSCRNFMSIKDLTIKINNTIILIPHVKRLPYYFDNIFFFEFSSNTSTKKLHAYILSVNVIAAYSRVCFLYLSFSRFLSRGHKEQKTRRAMDHDLRPSTEIKRKRPRGVDAFIIRCFNLSDASHPVTVAGVN